MTPPSRLAGFSLVEMAIVLVILALVAGGFLALVPARQDWLAWAAAERQLAETREALLGYAAANGHLPCPAKSASDGTEDRSAGECTGGKRNGLLPWASLGIHRTDPWGRLLRYSVTPAYTSSAAYFTLNSSGDVLLRTRNAGGALTDLTRSTEIVAAVWSTGKNGHWGWQPENTVPDGDSPGPNDDEDTNSSDSAAGTLLVSRQPSPADSPLGDFDDQMVWLPRSLLHNRMIAAGRLP